MMADPTSVPVPAHDAGGETVMLSIAIPAAVHNHVRGVCQLRGIDLGDVIVELLKCYFPRSFSKE